MSGLPTIDDGVHRELVADMLGAKPNRARQRELARRLWVGGEPAPDADLDAEARAAGILSLRTEAESHRLEAMRVALVEGHFATEAETAGRLAIVLAEVSVDLRALGDLLRTAVPAEPMASAGPSAELFDEPADRKPAPGGFYGANRP